MFTYLLEKRNHFGFSKMNDLHLLVLIVLTSSALLIFINHSTVKILSASRAYINGESHYSKAQKDATQHLVAFLYNHDYKEYNAYQKEIKVPLGDQKARIALNNGSQTDIIKQGFLEGRNHEEDLNDMIWLYKNFNQFPYFSDAIEEWEEGDALINKVVATANQIEEKIKNNTLSKADQQVFINDLNSIIGKITINQANFSNFLSVGTRKFKDILIITNIFFILLIITSVGVYYFKMIRKLKASNAEIERKKKDLEMVNKELDRFVYSASHDLRSPISSLMGLVVIIKLEKNIDKIKEYTDLMYQILQSQDQFINDIIDYSKNNRIKLKIEKVNLTLLINEAIFHNQNIVNHQGIEIIKKIETESIQTDVFRLKIILNNLISNAFKYSDEAKNEKWVNISTETKNSHVMIVVEDNGIGIQFWSGERGVG